MSTVTGLTIMHILSLDLAGQVGWARWREGMENPVYGVVKLPKHSLGQTVASFGDWLNAKIISERIEHIGVETIFVGKDAISAVERLYALWGRTHEVAYRRGVPIAGVMVGEWRQRFIGARRAPAGLTKPQRRMWLKKQAREECAARGWPVTSDDEADALGILVYERSRLMPTWGAEGELFGYEQIAPPMGMERVP
jgi:hypothetical protein